MSKLQFNLPDRLIIPITYFVVSNFMANKIQITNNHVIIEFDPRSLGLMSHRVQQYLSDIKHPNKDQNSAYSMTLD